MPSGVIAPHLHPTTEWTTCTGRKSNSFPQWSFIIVFVPAVKLKQLFLMKPWMLNEARALCRPTLVILNPAASSWLFIKIPVVFPPTASPPREHLLLSYCNYRLLPIWCLFLSCNADFTFLCQYAGAQTQVQVQNMSTENKSFSIKVRRCCRVVLFSLSWSFRDSLLTPVAKLKTGCYVSMAVSQFCR